MLTNKEINQLKTLLFKLEEDARFQKVLNTDEVFGMYVLYADEEEETEEESLQSVLTKMLNA